SLLSLIRGQELTRIDAEQVEIGRVVERGDREQTERVVGVNQVSARLGAGRELDRLPSLSGRVDQVRLSLESVAGRRGDGELSGAIVGLDRVALRHCGEVAVNDLGVAEVPERPVNVVSAGESLSVDLDRLGRDSVRGNVGLIA